MRKSIFPEIAQLSCCKYRLNMYIKTIGSGTAPQSMESKMHPANELRTTLNVMAMRAQHRGATDKQIALIVALAQGSNDYTVACGGMLTKGEASSIIDFMMAGGAKPDWTHHEEAVQPRVKKARRIKPAVEAPIVPADARRVRHVKFGVGTVLSEDNKAITVLFDGQTAACRIVAGSAFLIEI